LIDENAKLLTPIRSLPTSSKDKNMYLDTVMGPEQLIYDLPENDVFSFLAKVLFIYNT